MIQYTIKEKVNSWYETIIDYLVDNLGLGNGLTKIAATNIYRHKELEQDIYNIIEGTTILIYIYSSKKPNAFTLPGKGSTGADPSILRILGVTGIINRIPLLSHYSQLLTNVVILGSDATIIKNAGKSISNSSISSEQGLNFDTTNIKVIRNTQNNKIRMDLKEIVVYAADSLLEICDKDEVIAIILHEIGHNAQISLNLLDKVLSILKPIVYTALGAKAYQYISQNNNNIKNTNIASNLLILLVLSIVAKMFFSFFKRRQEIGADTFAIKCGYGKPLESALKKLHNHLMDFNSKSSKNIKGLNIIDKIFRLINSIYLKLNDIFVNKLKMGSYLDRNSRENYIKERTIQYEKDQAALKAKDNSYTNE